MKRESPVAMQPRAVSGVVVVVAAVIVGMMTLALVVGLINNFWCGKK